jgi:hypothetical protein
MNGFKKAFGINSPSKEMNTMGGYIISGLKNGIIEKFTGIKDWIKEHIFDKFINGFKSLFGIDSNSSSKMLTQGKSLMTGLKNGITGSDFISNIKDRIKTLVADKITGAMETAMGIKNKVSSVFSDLGKFTVEGFASGLKDNIQTAVDKVSELGTKVTNKLKGILGIASPSKVTKEIGKFVDMGLELGIANNADSVLDVAADLGDAVTTSITPTIPKLSAIANIPNIAKGMVLPSSPEFLSTINAVLEDSGIKDALDNIQELLENIVNQQDDSSTREPVVIQVKGRTIAQVVWDEEKQLYKQTGSYKPIYV